MKNIEFTQENYLALLEALGDNAPASTPLIMKLRTSCDNSVAINNCKVELRVATKFVPKNPSIELEKQDEYTACFTITNEDNRNHNQIVVEFLGEDND